MNTSKSSILLIGEFGVGKTHYGAQLLKRLMKGDGQLRMIGAASNLEPFEAAMASLNQGMAAGHTATSTYVDSVWPIADDTGREAELIWPDYGGEQVKSMLSSRSVPNAWKARIESTHAWLVLIRLHQIHVSDDVFSRPLSELRGARTEGAEVNVSDQARLIELLQMLMYARGLDNGRPIRTPRLSVLLTCWDELTTTAPPSETLRQQLPLLFEFVTSNWDEPGIMGVSALERPLYPRDRDAEYAARGPESFGYAVLQDGKRSPDLTLPVKLLLASVT